MTGAVAQVALDGAAFAFDRLYNNLLIEYKKVI